MNEPMDYTNWKHVEEGLKFDDLDLIKPKPMEYPSTYSRQALPLALHIPAPVAPVTVPGVSVPNKWIDLAGHLGTSLGQGAVSLFHVWVDGMNTWGDVTTAVIGSLVGGLGIMRIVGAILNLTGGARPRQRAAASWTYFSIPFIKAAPFIAYLAHAGVKTANEHKVEDTLVFAVANYHLGTFKRAADKYKMKYEQL